MSAGTVNLLVLAGIVGIVAAFIAITYIAATRRGGRKGGKMAKPPAGAHRRVNPKTGDLFR